MGRLLLAVFLLPALTPIENTMAEAEREVREILRNMTYPSEWTKNGQASLAEGLYEEPAAPGSASKVVVRLTDFVAMGTIDGRTIVALVIVTDSGGSGVFSDLYLMSQQEHLWILMDRAHLGDRIRVNSIAVERGLVNLDLTIQAPDDPICCPTKRSRIYYALQGRRLVKVNDPQQ
ncbi:MAG: hypothetical protein AB7G48_10475 [Nitrospiraceae bacterium]